MSFDEIKTETLNLRVAPSFKISLRTVAKIENRSMVNMLEVLLIDYLQRNGINLETTTMSKITAPQGGVNAEEISHNAR